MTDEKKHELFKEAKLKYPKGTILFFPESIESKEYESLGQFYWSGGDLRVKVIGKGSVWCGFGNNKSWHWADIKK